MSKQETNKATSSGIGLFSLLFLLFLGLKLGNVGVVATWSYWWITAPLWGPIVVIIVIAIIAGGIAALLSK